VREWLEAKAPVDAASFPTHDEWKQSLERDAQQIHPGPPSPFLTIRCAGGEHVRLVRSNEIPPDATAYRAFSGDWKLIPEHWKAER
jgi:hypothetical protein